MTKRIARFAWLSAVVMLLGSMGSASAQTGSTTTTGGTSTTGSSTGGKTHGKRTGGGGFLGGQQVLTPDQELAVLMDTLTTVEAILDSGQFQASSEVEILFLLFYVYESKYAAAVQGALAGGTSSAPTIPGLTTPGTTGTGTGTTGTPTSP
ncbi:MAG: hypothetical protein K8U57_35560 [Planctomycetes bacterium]|nr:hypothetical protein [Planctomycetota bacterium]